MTLHTDFFKENGGAQNTLKCGAVQCNGLGCQTAAAAGAVNGEGFIHSKLTRLELSSAAKDLHGKPNTIHFDLLSGDCKSGANGKTPLLPASSLPAAIVDYRGHLELGFRQSLICSKYPYPDQCCYGGVHSSSHGAQFAGRMMVLPLKLSSDRRPLFVNAKQYNGIMRRRKKRAEADLRNNLLKIRKPYQHLSRHLHAKRRPRGNGGRFLSSTSMAKNIRSESNSPGGSEVSSDGSSNAAALHLFQLNNLHHSFHHYPAAGIGVAMAPGNYLKV